MLVEVLLLVAYLFRGTYKEAPHRDMPTMRLSILFSLELFANEQLVIACGTRSKLQAKD